jgi:cytosolic carboxypeptidase protein 2/3
VCWDSNNMSKRRRSKKYYQLSFEYNFKERDDVVEFAYHIPYTFSRCE